jgi:hypothetical protein
VVCLQFTRTAVAQDRTPVMTTAVVPVVGTIDGMNGYRWKTDVQLRNDLPTEATVALTLPTVIDQPAMITTIPPGQTVSFSDVVAAFGVETALSPLLVLTEGRRSVVITATVYSTRGIEVSEPQPIAVEYGRVFFPQRTLTGLSFSDEFRTNVGVVNLNGRDAEFTLALQRVPGRNLAITHFVLPPNSIWHSSIQSLFPLITKGSEFTIVAETSIPDTYVYASVIANDTNVAHFIEPVFGAPSIQAASAGR